MLLSLPILPLFFDPPKLPLFADLRLLELPLPRDRLLPLSVRLPRRDLLTSYHALSACASSFNSAITSSNSAGKTMRRCRVTTIVTRA